VTRTRTRRSRHCTAGARHPGRRARRHRPRHYVGREPARRPPARPPAAWCRTCCPTLAVPCGWAITGTPGVGKSTTIDALGSFLTEQGRKVAVPRRRSILDPKPAESILADKTRMARLSADPNAFVAPLARLRHARRGGGQDPRVHAAAGGPATIPSWSRPWAPASPRPWLPT